MAVTFTFNNSRHVVESAAPSAIREEIAQKIGVPAEKIALLVNGAPLSEVNMGDIAVVLEVDGGAKGKKKKKNYTTPKHVPRKLKKVKLRVLKYYTFEGETVKSLRNDCVGACPVGVKMANHKTYAHCGRCGTMRLKN